MNHEESTKQIIMDVASDCAAELLNHDRKEDEELPRGAIEQAIESELISIDEIVTAFDTELRRRLGVQWLSIKEYADQKFVHVSELNEYFKIFSTTKEIDGDIEHCRKCGARGAKRTMLTKEPWTSAAHCGRCQSITLIIQGDHMSGNRNDTYIVYVSREGG